MTLCGTRRGIECRVRYKDLRFSRTRTRPAIMVLMARRHSSIKGRLDRSAAPAKDLAYHPQWCRNSPGRAVINRRQIGFQCTVLSLLNIRARRLELPCLHPWIIPPHQSRTTAEVFEEAIKRTSGV